MVPTGRQEHGIADTDADNDTWYVYPLVGTPPMEVRLAQNVDADPISVQIYARDEAISPTLRVRIRTGLEILNSYRLR
jgi:hypothetical protein